MRINEENIKKLSISDYDKGLLHSLLKDLEDIMVAGCWYQRKEISAWKRKSSQF